MVVSLNSRLESNKTEDKDIKPFKVFPSRSRAGAPLGEEPKGCYGRYGRVPPVLRLEIQPVGKDFKPERCGQ